MFLYNIYFANGKPRCLIGYKLRAVPYFSLQSYPRRKPCGQVAKPRSAKRGRFDLHWFHWKALAEKRKARAWKVSGTQGKFSIVKSLFTISLGGIRTKQILREKAGCKQSRKTFLNVWNKHDDLKTRSIVRRDFRVCLNNKGLHSFLCRALVTMPHMERSKIVFFPPHWELHLAVMKMVYAKKGGLQAV